MLVSAGGLLGVCLVSVVDLPGFCRGSAWWGWFSPWFGVVSAGGLLDGAGFLPGWEWFSIHFRLQSNPMVREKLVQPFSSIAKKLISTTMD